MNPKMAVLFIQASLLGADAYQLMPIEVGSSMPFKWPMDEGSASKIGAEKVEELIKLKWNKASNNAFAGIGSFRFVTLAKGKVFLVASIDTTGRNDFDLLEVIHCEGGRCQSAGIPSDHCDDLSKGLIDVDGDGVYEIITRTMVNVSFGIDIRPIFKYYIMALQSSTIVDTSIRHKAYFKEHIVPIMDEDKRELQTYVAQRNAALQSQTPEEFPISYADRKRWNEQCEIELAYRDIEYRHRVLGDSDGGVNLITEWTRNPNPLIKEFAIRCLGEIGTTKARIRLREIAKEKSAAGMAARNELRLTLGEASGKGAKKQ